MATKMNPELEVPVNEEEQAAEKPEKKDADMQKQLAAQKAEIEKLKKQLAANPVTRAKDDAEAVRQAAKEAAEKGIDPWTVTVSIRIPHRNRNEEPWYWLNVNGRSVQIPADDRYQELKLPWAETLINSLEAERMAADYQDGIEVYDPVTNPHR